MKGIIAEINGKYAVILTQDGSFRKIKAAPGMAVGCEINLDQPAGNVNMARFIARISSVAAAALFIIGIGIGAYSYTVPYSYLDVDINPSIEITANVFDRIIKIEALNEEGKKLLSNSELKNARLENGVTQLISNAAEQGYLKGEPLVENAVLFTVSSKDDKKSIKLKTEVEKAAINELDRSNIKSEVLIAEASIKQKDDAKVLGVTPGKLALIEDAIEDDPELKLEELKKAPVRELVKKAREKKALEEEVNALREKEKAKENDENKNNEAGNGNIDIKNKNNQTQQNENNRTGVQGLTSKKEEDSSKVKSTAANENKSNNKSEDSNNNINNGNGNKAEDNKNSNKKNDQNNNVINNKANTPERERLERKKLKDELLGINKKSEQNKDKGRGKN